MLTPKEAEVIKSLVYLAEDYAKEAGPCEHEVNICVCGVTALIIDGYEILHSNGIGEHTWVTDYDWDSSNNILRVLRCEKCYVEKSAAKA